MATLTPQQMDEWEELQRIDGWGDGWRQAGTVAAAANNAGVFSGAAFTGSVNPELLTKPADYIPGEPASSKTSARQMTAEESERLAEQRARARNG